MASNPEFINQHRITSEAPTPPQRNRGMFPEQHRRRPPDDQAPATRVTPLKTR